MLDPAILQSLEARFPPEQPAIVEERVWRSVAGEAIERIGQRASENFEHDANAWITSLDRQRRLLDGVQVVIDDPARDIDQLTGLIADFEALADWRAERGAKLEKQIARSVKAAFKIDPSVAAARRSFGQRMIATEKRVIEAMLDYALLLRAIRSEVDPATSAGPVLDSEGMRDHLARLGAV